jgi:hypothetical protein
MVEKDDHF